MNPSGELLKLYKGFGYRQYKMSKFEEYDLYAGNREFLTSGQIITFTDTNGKLMALKPDVTLSIIKNTVCAEGTVQKIFYDENVYRVSGGTGAFKEIRQAGLECIGQIGVYDICEVLTLAAESLKKISADYVLDVSSLSILSCALDALSLSKEVRAQCVRCIGEKNRHDLARILHSAGVPDETAGRFTSLAALYGKTEDVLRALRELSPELIPEKNIRALGDVLHALPEEIRSHIRIDLSSVGNMNYYNDIVFAGYVDGIPSAVLTGGQYGSLMKRMGKNAQAIGFAVYLDLLTRLNITPSRFDYEYVLLYNEDDDPAGVMEEMRKLSQKGPAIALRTLPEDIRACRILKYGYDREAQNERHA